MISHQGSVPTDSQRFVGDRFLPTDLLVDKLFDESETALRAINSIQCECDNGISRRQHFAASLLPDEILNNGYESDLLQAEIALSNSAGASMHIPSDFC